MPIVTDTFAKRLRELRIKKGFSQEELGRAIDSTKAAISRFELSKTKRISDLAIDRLAKVLNVNKEWLLGETDKRRAYQNARNGPANDDETEFLDKYRSLNKNGKTLAQSQMDGLVKTPALSKKAPKLGAEYDHSLLIAASGAEDLDEEGMERARKDIEDIMRKYGGGNDQV